MQVLRPVFAISGKELGPFNTMVRFWLGALLLSGIAISGCALNDKREDAITRDVASSPGNRTQSAVPPGYPYPPEELWRRLVEVIKTHPDELTHRKIGQIFGLEFDENKIGWRGDKASRKYFLLTKDSIRETEAFPFKQISLMQGAPDSSAEVRIRWMAFHFDPFDHKESKGVLLRSSRTYCIQPKFSDIEALGYRYDEFVSRKGPFTRDISGGPVIEPFRSEFFSDNIEDRSRRTKQVSLEVLPENGCLVGVIYINHPQF